MKCPNDCGLDNKCNTEIININENELENLHKISEAVRHL